MTSDPANQPENSRYEVVARRYRPQLFDQLIGQSQVTRALENAITTNRVGHAYLFTGARGVGKTSAARIFAKALNCVQGPTTTPCNECDTCSAVSTGDDMDVLEIDGASNRGIEEIRQLRSNIAVRPSRSKYKIYVIDEVHMLTREAFNALLKTLEEPPGHVKFIFCTTDPEKMPITVLSRCQRYDFAPVETAEILKRLREITESEGATAEDEALELLARRAAGSMRDSQSLLEQLLSFAGSSITVADVHAMLGTAQNSRIRQIVTRLVDRDSAAALKELDEAVAEGVDVGQLVEQLLGHLRDMMVMAVDGSSEILMHNARGAAEQLRETARFWGVETMLAAMQILDQTLVRLRQSLHARVLAEMALVRIANLQDLCELANLVDQLREEVGNDSRASSPAGAKKKQPAGMSRSVEQAARVSSPDAALPPKTPRVNEAFLANNNSQPDDSPGLQSHSAVDDAPETTHHGTSDTAGGTATLPGGTATLPRPTTQVESAAQSQVASPVDTHVEATDVVAEVHKESCDLSNTNVESFWKRMIAQLDGILADYLRQPLAVQINDEGKIVATVADSHLFYCDHPDKRDQLGKLATRLAGRRVLVEFRADKETTPREVGKMVKKPTARELIRQSYEHAMVREAVDLFDAEILRVGRRPGTSPGQ